MADAPTGAAAGRTVRCACDERAVLGEGPIWVARERAVYWVDIRGRALHRLTIDDRRHSAWSMPGMLCWVAERQSGAGFIAGYDNRFSVLQLDPLRIESIGAPEPERPQNRMNDAAVDRDGCIWAGTMDDAEQAPTGALWRLDRQREWHRQDDGYVVSNGPTFSPDHDVMYHTDSNRRVIYRFPLHAEGRLGRREVFVKFRDDWGAPDGMATDAEGGIWVAHWGGGRVSRFLPDGRLDRAIAIPASRVTSCCFAGDGLDRLFVTTASIGCEDEPLSGCLFEVAPGVRGAPTFAYGG